MYLMQFWYVKLIKPILIYSNSQLDMGKQQVLHKFLDQYKHLPEQGSDAWKDQRMGRIGGSEVATLLKQNKYKSVNKLIMEKLNFDPFTGSVITYWGNVFEELIRLHSEQTFACQIMETGSIPYNGGYLSYSPDGLSVVSASALRKYLPVEDLGLVPHKEHLVLFEFKCPHSRIPDHSIPDHYRPQITIGMNIIDIMEVGIFIQAVYRRCSFRDIEYNTRHNGFGHFKQWQSDVGDSTRIPKEVGFIIMYSEVEYAHDLRSLLGEDWRNGRIDGAFDIGSVYDGKVFEQVMGACVSKHIKMDYSFRETYVPEVFSSDGMRQAFYNVSLQYQAKKALHAAQEKYGDRLIGVLPYKLLDVYITPVAKDHTYIESTNVLNKAKSVIKCIDDHRDQDLPKADIAKSVRTYKL